MITADNLSSLDWLLHGFGLRDSVYPPDLTTVHQIHSAIVLDAAELTGETLVHGDAIISSLPGVTVAVKTADCVPILLVDTANRIVATVHAGWRGMAAGIAVRAVDELISRYGTRTENLRAAIGPSIGKCCYEVGPEVVSHFGTNATEKVHLDLKAIARAQLATRGISNIWESQECTFCNGERFFSFRREKERAGRMMSFAGTRIEAAGKHDGRTSLL